MGLCSRPRHARGRSHSILLTNLSTFSLLVAFFLQHFIVSCSAYGNDDDEYEEEDKRTDVSVNLYDESWESSWVPVIAGGVIITIVFSISLFACCLHCPGCYINKRTNPDQIV